MNAALDRIATDVGAQRRFIANAAHEMRTPISVMGARLELLPAGEMRAELLGDVERLAAIVGQLLSIARFGDVEHPVDDVLHLARVARDVIARQAPLAVRLGRQIALDVVGVPAPIRGNLAAVESALANVIDNAVHAEPPGGTVVVTGGLGVSIAVADHGSGLSAADREQAFEPFWRADASRPGTGLGLAIVRAAMALHDGTATAAETPGGVATFVLAFGGSAPSG